MESLQAQNRAGQNTAGGEGNGKKGLSGSTLKLIAVITMLIDHIGAAILGRYLMATGYMEIALSGEISSMIAWLQEYSTLYWSYTAMRMIGRIAFPIFCFLLIEGFQKTHDRKKYALRLFIFALVSELPFDLAFKARIFDMTYQNVFFTLFFGFLALLAYDKISQKSWLEKPLGDKAVRPLLSAAALAVCAAAAELLRADYGALGVLMITVLYVFRTKKPAMIAAGCVAFAWELTAPLAFIPIGFYNGKRGLKLKYMFYLFYPLHLLILYGIAACLGMGAYPAM